MAKIIGIDNFGRDTVSDVLVQEGLKWRDALAMVTEKNSKLRDSSPYYYKVVPDDYELYDHTKNY